MKKPVVRWILNGGMETASSRLRGYLPLEVLRKSGWNVNLYQPGDLEQSEIFVFQKRYSQPDIDLALRAKELGKTVIFDLCDNHFYNPTGSAELEERSSRLGNMISICDHLILSTEVLRNFVSHHKITVIDDAIEIPKINWWKKLYFTLFKNVASKDKVNLAWFGNSGQQSPSFGLIDLQRIIPELNETNKSVNLRVNVFSDSPAIYEQTMRKAEFEHHFYKWQKETFSYFFSQHQACLIPISINPFTECKTANRVITSLLHDVPVIADVIPSYREFEQFIFVSNWKENILKIAERGHDKAAHGAREYILSKFSSDHILNQWTEALTIRYV